MNSLNSEINKLQKLSKPYNGEKAVDRLQYNRMRLKDEIRKARLKGIDYSELERELIQVNDDLAMCFHYVSRQPSRRFIVRGGI